MARNRGKILVIRGGALGDFILTLPALSALRETFPETHLEVIGYTHLAELARAGGVIDAFKSIESRALAGFFSRNVKLDPVFSEYFESFALVISYLYDPDEMFQDNVKSLMKGQFIQGPHRPSEGLDFPASKVFLSPLEKLAIYDYDPVPALRLPGLPAAALGSARWLAAHPGSGSETKNWPEGKWLQLLSESVATTAFQILLIGGEAEGEKVNRIKEQLPEERCALAQRLPLLEVAQRIQQCEGFVGHDSGIAHLASALGVPSLLLWGQSNDQIWRPLSPQTEIVVERDLARLEVATALAAFRRKFPAS